MGRVFMPQDMKRLVFNADLGFVTPSPSPEKPLRLPDPPKQAKQSSTLDLPSASGGSLPGLRSGESLALIQQVVDLNEKVTGMSAQMVVLTENSNAIRDDLHGMVRIFCEMVKIFREDVPKVSQNITQFILSSSDDEEEVEENKEFETKEVRKKDLVEEEIAEMDDDSQREH